VSLITAGNCIHSSNGGIQPLAAGIGKRKNAQAPSLLMPAAVYYRSPVPITIHLSYWYLAEAIIEHLRKLVPYMCSAQMLWCLEIITTYLQVTAYSLLHLHDKRVICIYKTHVYWTA
jgi:hypothetical protein